MSNLVFNFTNTYRIGDYPGFDLIDFSNLSGTDMYVDEEAQSEISQVIKNRGVDGIHLIDSGNYHYMTRLFTQQINEPYILVYFDNHTDMKPAMFDMLSCGSWAAASIQKDEKLKRIVMIGPPQKSIDEISVGSRLEIVSKEMLTSMGTSAYDGIFTPEEASEGSDLPIYFSIDKDVLSKEEVETNWDQGNMTMDMLMEFIQKLSQGRRVIGADICGLLPLKDIMSGKAQSVNPLEKGIATDKKLIEVLWQIIYQ